jgi:hypothetical protein
VGIGIYGAMEDKRKYEEKVFQRQQIRLQQQRAREAEAKKEIENYSKR